MDDAPLIERFLPAWQFRERHSRRVRAAPDCVIDAVRSVTPQEIRFFVLLTSLRYLPARLLGRGPAWDAGRPMPLLEVATRNGFLPLGAASGRDLVFGTVGQFWRLRRRDCPPVATPEAFTAFDAPGFVKAAIDFRAHDEGGGWTRVTTETRVAATDTAARRRFALYWAIIRPWSGLIRRMWLAAIARRAEAATAPARAGT